MVDWHIRSNKDMCSWLQGIIERGDDRESKRVCEIILDRMKDWRPKRQLEVSSFTIRLVGKIIEESITLRDVGLCQKALCAVKTDIPQPQTAEAIRQFGLAKIKSA